MYNFLNSTSKSNPLQYYDFCFRLMKRLLTVRDKDGAPMHLNVENHSITTRKYALTYNQAAAEVFRPLGLGNFK